MSFGAGHIQDMNNRMKQNRAQRPSNRPKFKENNREAIYSEGHKEKKRPRFKTLSKVELVKLKSQIREKFNVEHKRELIIKRIFWTCALIAVVVFLVLVN